MTMTATVTASEAAYMLHKALGALRAWGDFLADNIRGKQSIHGLTLEPCCLKKIQGAYRPMYAVADVHKFIAAVLACEPAARTKAPITVIDLPVERGRPWRAQKFKRIKQQSSNPTGWRDFHPQCNTGVVVNATRATRAMQIHQVARPLQHSGSGHASIPAGHIPGRMPGFDRLNGTRHYS